MTHPADGIAVSRVAVGVEWLGGDGAMSAAGYLKLFDDAGDELTQLAGMGEDYTRATRNSWVALESHLTFRLAARCGDALRIESRVLDLDDKKIHVYQEMYRGTALLAAHEQLGLHFDTAARRACPFEPDVLERLRSLHAAQRRLPRPLWIGRGVAAATPAAASAGREV